MIAAGKKLLPKTALLAISAAVLALLLSSSARANLAWRNIYFMPPGISSADIIDEDIVYAINSYYHIITTVENPKQLKLYKYGLNGTIATGFPHTLSDSTGFFLPSICWDGRNFAIAYSTHTQARFRVISPTGGTVLGPLALPGIPSGLSQRTSAFKVYWTGKGYAIFGIVGWLSEPGYYITSLFYWFVDPSGAFQIPGREIVQVAPLSYPPTQEEEYYYDAAWNGTNFFVAYANKEVTGPPTLYRVIDIFGNTVRGEQSGFVSARPSGPVVAWSGSSFALVGLQAVTLKGNFLYARFFNASGNPLGAEKNFGKEKFAVSPTVHWDGRKFITAYSSSVIGPPPDLIYYTGIFINPFTSGGAKLGGEYAIVYQDWNYGGTNLGVNLKMAGFGRDFLFQGMQGGGPILDNYPFVYWVRGDSTATPNTPPWGPFPPLRVHPNKTQFNAAGDRLELTADVDPITTPFFPFVRFIFPDGSTKYLTSQGKLLPSPAPYVGNSPMVLPSAISGYPILAVNFGGLPAGTYRVESGAIDAAKSSLGNLVYTKGGVWFQNLVLQ